VMTPVADSNTEAVADDAGPARQGGSKPAAAKGKRCGTENALLCSNRAT
jgi:hypothetical protein